MPCGLQAEPLLPRHHRPPVRCLFSQCHQDHQTDSHRLLRAKRRWRCVAWRLLRHLWRLLSWRRFRRLPQHLLLGWLVQGPHQCLPPAASPRHPSAAAAYMPHKTPATPSHQGGGGIWTHSPYFTKRNVSSAADDTALLEGDLSSFPRVPDSGLSEDDLSSVAHALNRSVTMSHFTTPTHYNFSSFGGNTTQAAGRRSVIGGEPC
mmetsp:Transcript_33195/g.82168  ORF Transcript_33195/g.82168 Transcript_33195/m.82168 type:complete len:205 (+) Transcript_33195:1124-1738(+)